MTIVSFTIFRIRGYSQGLTKLFLQIFTLNHISWTFSFCSEKFKRRYFLDYLWHFVFYRLRLTKKKKDLKVWNNFFQFSNFRRKNQDYTFYLVTKFKYTKYKIRTKLLCNLFSSGIFFLFLKLIWMLLGVLEKLYIAFIQFCE